MQRLWRRTQAHVGGQTAICQGHIQDCSPGLAPSTLPPMAPHAVQFHHHPRECLRRTLLRAGPHSHLSVVFGLLQRAGVAQLVAQQAERADAAAVLAAEELKELVVLRALPLLQVPHGRAQLMVAEGRAVVVRPQVLGAEGGHAGEAGLRGGRLQTTVAVDGGCRLLLFLLVLIVLLPVPAALQLLHHPAQHRVLVELRAVREGGAALRAAEVPHLAGPGLLQAVGTEVVPAGHRHGGVEDAEADGARQVLLQRQQIRLRLSFGQRRHSPAAAVRLRRNETGAAAFRSIAWHFPASRGARRVRSGLHPAGAAGGAGTRGSTGAAVSRGGAMRAGRERGCPEPCPAGGSRVRGGGCGVTAGCAGAAARSRARVNRALPRPPRAGCGPTGAGAGGASEVPVCYCYCYCYCCCCVRAETTQGVSSSVLIFGGFCFFLKPTKRGRSKARALGSQLSRELKGQRPQPGPPPLQELRSGLGRSGAGPAGSGAGLSATAELSSERAVAELRRAASQVFVVARCGSVAF